MLWARHRACDAACLAGSLAGASVIEILVSTVARLVRVIRDSATAGFITTRPEVSTIDRPSASISSSSWASRSANPSASASNSCSWHPVPSHARPSPRPRGPPNPDHSSRESWCHRLHSSRRIASSDFYCSGRARDWWGGGLVSGVVIAVWWGGRSNPVGVDVVSWWFPSGWSRWDWVGWFWA